MGLILSLFKDNGVNDVFLDFSAEAAPTDQELEIYNVVKDSIQRSAVVLSEIQEYKGAGEVVRKAMASATQQNEEAAFLALIGCVDSIKHFFDYSQELERIFPQLLKTLAEPNEEKKSSLQDQQALAKQLAQLLDFVLQFDSTRMKRPNLPNDFSYYRRLLPKFNKHPATRVKDDEAQRLQMFTAEHIPMLTSLSRATTAAARENQYVLNALSCMANSCLSMIDSKKFNDPHVQLLCARAMTGAIVLYDHVDPLGVFRKSSPVQIRQCILSLKRDFPQEEGLLNAIQFSSKHFRDATTPSNITSLFNN